MRPDDLIEFSRQFYANPHLVEGLTQEEHTPPELYADEVTLLGKLPKTGGALLLLGVGGGREAIPLARLGFAVTGVDFVPAMVERAKANAARHGLSIEGLVQEISSLNLPAASYEVAWLAAAMYSCVPGRSRRVAMLERIRDTLVPGGHFICQFFWRPSPTDSPRGRLLRKAIAGLTLGNFTYEPGDMLLGNHEFIHAFGSADAVRDEFLAAGFEVTHLQVPQRGVRGGAILKRP